MTEKQNLFILYPPGLGGNHLANMLSMANGFTPRFDVGDYYRPTRINKIIEHHYAEIPQFDVDKTLENLEDLKNQNNVFCGHWISFYKFKESGLFKEFPNQKILSIQIPTSEQKGFARLTRTDQALGQYPWSLYELSLLYRADYIALLLNKSMRDCCNVKTDLLFGTDFSLVLKDLENQGLELDLDINVVQPLHDKWLYDLTQEI
jgi:hypothetical protein